MQQSSTLKQFQALLGEKNVLTTPEDTLVYLREWRDKYIGAAAAVLRPKTVDEIAAIVKIANENGVCLVPQGGNTGLVGAQIAFDAERQFVVNLSRMNAIRDIDPIGYTLTAEAGVILETVQNTADDVDRLFPLSLGSEGSCQIGGNLSSNAGGTGVLAYGNARDLVLGLEVVLPSGEIYRGLNRLKKDNTGYDLKNLFIGAEGTLGFITAATLKLFPKPRGYQTGFMAFNTLESVAEFYTLIQSRTGQMLTTFEIIPRIGLDFLTKHVHGARDPIEGRYDWYALIEISSSQSDDHASQLIMNIVEEAMERGFLADGTLAASAKQRADFWHLRHELSGCQKPEGGSIKHDVSVPVACLPDFFHKSYDAIKAFMPDCRPVPFGHWGDGNIHYNISQPVEMDTTKFLGQWEPIAEIIHDVALSFGGSISAEHGIGVMKREALSKIKDPVALQMMKQLKANFDPNGIMNPGKVL